MTAATSIRFTVPGPAVAKARARATHFGSHIRFYTDPQTAAYEKMVGQYAKIAMKGQEPFSGALRMELLIRVKPIKSVTKRQRMAMLSGEVRPAKKPDLTNLVKGIEDGCNAIVFTDDALIVELFMSKIYAETDGVDVFIEPVGKN